MRRVLFANLTASLRVFGDLYRDILETCFDKCVEHPAGEKLSNNVWFSFSGIAYAVKSATCVKACGLLYHESFNMVTQENGRRVTLMKYLSDEQRTS